MRPLARQLESEKAMRCMIAYLQYVKPRKAELIVDEMLAICNAIEAWKKKKAVGPMGTESRGHFQ